MDDGVSSFLLLISLPHELPIYLVNIYFVVKFIKQNKIAIKLLLSTKRMETMTLIITYQYCFCLASFPVFGKIVSFQLCVLVNCSIKTNMDPQLYVY